MCCPLPPYSNSCCSTSSGLERPLRPRLEPCNRPVKLPYLQPFVATTIAGSARQYYSTNNCLTFPSVTRTIDLAGKGEASAGWSRTLVLPAPVEVLYTLLRRSSFARSNRSSNCVVGNRLTFRNLRSKNDAGNVERIVSRSQTAALFLH